MPLVRKTSHMADEDTVLEEALDNLKEAGQRVRRRRDSGSVFKAMLEIDLGIPLHQPRLIRHEEPDLLCVWTEQRRG